MVTRESKTTNKIAIPKIRPASWRVYVQGEQEAQFVRRVLGEAGIEVTEPEREPGLTDPPLYAVVATPQADVPLTQEELVAILDREGKLVMEFEAS